MIVSHSTCNLTCWILGGTYTHLCWILHQSLPVPVGEFIQNFGGQQVLAVLLVVLPDDVKQLQLHGVSTLKYCLKGRSRSDKY